MRNLYKNTLPMKQFLYQNFSTTHEEKPGLLKYAGDDDLDFAFTVSRDNWETT